MQLRFAVVGMSTKLSEALVGALDSRGDCVVVIPDLPVDLAYLARQYPQLLLVDASQDWDAALRLAGEVTGRMATVLLAKEVDADRLRRAMRVGCVDVLDPWQDTARLRELMQELASQALPQGELGQVRVVLGCQGGVGATSVSVALGQLLSQDPDRAVVVTDMDAAGGDLAAVLDMPEGATTADLLDHQRRLDIGGIRGMVERHDGGFWVLPQPPENLDSVTISEQHAQSLIGVLNRAFSDIVVDMGSALGEAGRRVAVMADDVILVTSQEVPALRKALRRLKILRELGLESARIHVVINRYHARRYPQRSEIEQQLRHPVLATIGNDYAAVNEALDAGATVFEARPRSVVARDLRVLKARLLGEDEPRRQRSWWR